VTEGRKPHTERYSTVVQLELPAELVADMDDIAKREHLTRSEVATRLLAMSIQELTFEAAFDLFQTGSVTAVAAAEMCHMTTWEFMDRAQRRM
jgi:metal-responsive CopG/Arc/MetJ family transcriptional regulator